MAFANFSTGYKSGGYNSGGGTSVADHSRRCFQSGPWRQFARETVKNYEIGIKSNWLDRALKLNLTLYQMDIAIFRIAPLTGSASSSATPAASRQKGFEFDTVIAPSAISRSPAR